MFVIYISRILKQSDERICMNNVFSGYIGLYLILHLIAHVHQDISDEFDIYDIYIYIYIMQYL